MDLTKKYTGLRLSPVIQFGRITAFMPTDEAPIPYGIQTDIHESGGSSGSPIIELSSGKVIGIVQEVLLTTVEGLSSNPFASHSHSANRLSVYADIRIGLAYGLNIQIFYDLFQKIRENITGDAITSKFVISKFKIVKG